MKANIRMYNIGQLGDCFLITFSSGRSKANVLIDCGAFWKGDKSSQKLNKIVEHIKTDIPNQKLDLLVATHQHNDHMSGFHYAESLFNEIKTDNIFLSWLDNPKDPVAKTIKDDIKKITSNLVSIKHVDNDIIELMDSLIDFNAHGESLTDKATNFLKTKENSTLHYTLPGESYPLPGKLSSKVKVHILGPPKSIPQLKDISASRHETYDPHLKSMREESELFNSIEDFRSGDKIDERVNNLDKQYIKPWSELSSRKEDIFKEYRKYPERNIDHDWKKIASGFALHLDRFTNNTSMVLAFELVESGKFLLFVGDAQTGNWNSWSDVEWVEEDISTDRILENTIFYKVGHHGSHNATQPEIFEKINSPELIAMIPVHKDDPNLKKEKPWKMPAKNLYKRLLEKTQNRVLRMDDEEILDGSNWKKKPRIKKGEYVEVEIEV